MYSTLVSFAILASVTVTGVLADLKIGTPVLKQCGTSKITWAESKGPYNVIAVPAENPCEKVLADLGDHSGPSMDWKVAMPAGTKIMLSLEDANGDDGWTGEVTVGPSDDVSCLSAAQRAAIPSSSASASASVSSSVAVKSTPVSSSVTATVTPLAGTVVNVGAGAATTPSGVATAVGAAGAGVLGNSNGAASLALSGSVLGGAFLAALALF